jgi:nucleoid-associated protein YgaU
MRIFLSLLVAMLVFTTGCQTDNGLDEPTQRPTYNQSRYAQPDPIEPPADDTEVVTATTMREPLPGTGASPSNGLGPAGDASEPVGFPTHEDRQDNLDRTEGIPIRIVSEDRPTRVPAAPTGFSYTLKKGDTLWQLSGTYLGAGKRWREIRDANPGLKPEALPIGTDIWIPAK